jgi:hypothetical protein
VCTAKDTLLTCTQKGQCELCSEAQQTQSFSHWFKLIVPPTYPRPLYIVSGTLCRVGVERKSPCNTTQHCASKSMEFSWEGLLKAIAEFIVCDNQVGNVKLCATVFKHVAVAEFACGKQDSVPKLSSCHASQIYEHRPSLNLQCINIYPQCLHQVSR